MSKLLFDGSLRRGDASDGHAEGRAGDVVHAETGAELHGAGLAAVLAADADFEIGTGCTTFLYSHSYKLTNTYLIEYLEGIYLDDAVVFVEFQEFGCVVTRETEGHLREVVRSE